MKLSTIAASITLATSLLGPAAPSTQRPYAITSTHGVIASFDDGTCGLVMGLPRTGALGSYWRPDVFGGVWSYGYTMADTGELFTFVPSWC